ncbi:MAG: gluconate 2-dehydrogenase subunit 3 family protein, partial [Gemmatimonadetes bacterium]|nr:gluconate 2-dehydrogenase subunit 3 family protein [Gemmatimonadota bacterium]
MSGGDRRSFLKKGALLSAAAAAGGVAPASAEAVEPRVPAAPDPTILRALAEVVLPSALGPEGRERAVGAFEGWLERYEPAYEVNHGYGTHEIVYGPAHPGPGWEAQLRALDIEARKRTGRAFVELAVAERRKMVERQLEGAAGRLPSPARAGHVAVGLLAHWAASSDAHDLAYGARIGPQRCRGLQG